MAVRDVLATVAHPYSAVVVLMDGSSSAATLFQEMETRRVPWGCTVLQAATNSPVDPNSTQESMARVISAARAQVSWCVTVVVVSDDLAFLSTFAQWSLKGRLLVWSTRLLVVTRLPLHHLQVLHGLLSSTNSILLIAEKSSRLYVYWPFASSGAQASLLASWTPRVGLAFTTQLKLFPDKFSKLQNGPELVVAAEEFEPHIALVKEKSVTSATSFTGPMVNLLKIIAKSVNFTYRYVRPPDGSWGAKLADGSWTGMVGMVGRGEADFGLGPFGVSATRAEMVDFTREILTETARIMGGRGVPEVNPWGFLLPLEPLVWAATLAALVMLFTMVYFLSLLGLKATSNNVWSSDAPFLYIRIFLQQANTIPPDLMWERLTLATWLIAMLVISKSYAGNLMSYLAVRYIPQPYQSLRDVLDDPSVTMIWEANNAYVQYYRAVQSGIFREIADSEKKGRIKYVTSTEFPSSVDIYVRRGHHVLIAEDRYEKVLMAQDFSRTGRCDFYSSEARFLPFMSSMVGQKDSPLVAVISRSIKTVTQTGLYDHWTEAYMPNATSCAYPPTKITVNTSLGLHNLWGMFAVLVGGLSVSLVILGLELLTARLQKL
nr:probable glutamate receptor [Procambarus clarkii]